MADLTENQANTHRLSKQPRSRQGCQTCRSRRVKCDEERPHCRTCVRIHKECIWTRPLKFRDQNTMAAQGYTVVGPRTKEASEFTDKPSHGMSDMILMSVKDGHRSDCFGDADFEGWIGRDVLPARPRSDSITSPSWMDALKLEQLYWRGFRMRPSVDTAYSDRCQALTTTLSYYLPLDELSFQPKNVDKWLTAGFITPHNSALLSIRTPTLAAAVDTLILTQAAARTHDDRLAQHAIKKYTISIASLRESIAEIGNYERNDVLLAIFMLQLGETFSPISRPGELLPHIDGAARILEYEGPRRLSSSYDTALFTHARQHAILGGLLRREHTFFNQPQWLAVCQSAPTSNHLTRLLDIGSPVPGLLAETDKVGSNIRSEHFIYELLRKLDCSYEEIVTWIEEFCSSMVHEIGTTIDPKEMEAYSEEVDGDPITLPILKFASFRTAWRITLGWTFQYTILQAIHDILTIRVDVVYKHKASELESEMFRVITNLSMVIPQLFDKRFGAIGRAAITLPLTILTEFYSSRGGARELNWCRKIAKAVNNPREGLKPIWMHEWKEGVHVHARKS